MITLPNICLIVFTLSQPPTMKQNIKLHFPNFFCSKLFHALSAWKDLHLSFCIYSRDLQVKNCNWYLFVCRGPWTKTSQYNIEMCYTTFRSAVSGQTTNEILKKVTLSWFFLYIINATDNSCSVILSVYPLEKLSKVFFPVEFYKFKANKKLSIFSLAVEMPGNVPLKLYIS